MYQNSISIGFRKAYNTVDAALMMSTCYDGFAAASYVHSDDYCLHYYLKCWACTPWIGLSYTRLYLDHYEKLLFDSVVIGDSHQIVWTDYYWADLPLKS